MTSRTLSRLTPLQGLSAHDGGLSCFNHRSKTHAQAARRAPGTVPTDPHTIYQQSLVQREANPNRRCPEGGKAAQRSRAVWERGMGTPQGSTEQSPPLPTSATLPFLRSRLRPWPLISQSRYFPPIQVLKICFFFSIIALEPNRV